MRLTVLLYAVADPLSGDDLDCAPLLRRRELWPVALGRDEVRGAALLHLVRVRPSVRLHRSLHLCSLRGRDARAAEVQAVEERHGEALPEHQFSALQTLPQPAQRDHGYAQLGRLSCESVVDALDDETGRLRGRERARHVGAQRERRVLHLGECPLAEGDADAHVLQWFAVLAHGNSTKDKVIKGDELLNYDPIGSKVRRDSWTNNRTSATTRRTPYYLYYRHRDEHGYEAFDSRRRDSVSEGCCRPVHWS